MLYDRDGSTTRKVSGQTCASYGWSAGGTCGPTAGGSNADLKNETLTIPTDWRVWNASNFMFAYVAIRVPPKQGTSRSLINGLRYEVD